ncbi:MAG: Fic family protein [Sinobacteraceae bacterium]|nr:Fic family protein [Nevskiaceae bacterium]
MIFETPRYLPDFIAESNRIEGIHRPPTAGEIVAHEKFLHLERLSRDDLVRFVSAVQPNARIRSWPGMDVRVGDHFPPPGGQDIPKALTALLRQVNALDPWALHCQYETLHPFTDGNGRSGRVLWAWQMLRVHGGFPLGFLHHAYYQALRAWRG